MLSVSEPAVEGDDATRVLVRQLLGGIARYERAVIRGRMMAGKAAKVARGGYGGGRPAYGLKADGKKLVKEASKRVGSWRRSKRSVKKGFLDRQDRQRA